MDFLLRSRNCQNLEEKYPESPQTGTVFASCGVKVRSVAKLVHMYTWLVSRLMGDSAKTKFLVFSFICFFRWWDKKVFFPFSFQPASPLVFCPEVSGNDKLEQKSESPAPRPKRIVFASGSTILCVAVWPLSHGQNSTDLTSCRQFTWLWKVMGWEIMTAYPDNFITLNKSA